MVGRKSWTEKTLVSRAIPLRSFFFWHRAALPPPFFFFLAPNQRKQRRKSTGQRRKPETIIGTQSAAAAASVAASPDERHAAAALAAHLGPARRLALTWDAYSCGFPAIDGWLRSPTLDGLRELELHCRARDARFSRAGYDDTPSPLPLPLPELLRFSTTLRLLCVSCDWCRLDIPSAPPPPTTHALGPRVPRRRSCRAACVPHRRAACTDNAGRPRNPNSRGDTVQCRRRWP